jgi:hypothetical protein
VTGGALRVSNSLALFALGAAVGAGAVGMASTAASRPPNLVAGQVVSVDYDPSAAASIAVSVEVYNAGDHDITARPVSIAGWALTGDESEPRVLSARSWTELALSAVPMCDGPLTDVIMIEADDAQHRVVTGRHLVERLSYVRQDYCGLGRHVFVEPEPVSTSIDGTELVMDLRLPAHGRTLLGEQVITGVYAQTPGFTVLATGVPALFRPDVALTISVRWHIEDCRVAARNVLNLGLTFITDGNVVVEAWFGDRGVALLTRYVAAQCTT